MHELKAGVTKMCAVEKNMYLYIQWTNSMYMLWSRKGSKHPMLDKSNFIEWITLNTKWGIYRKQLIPGQEPIADFCLCDGEYVEEIYAYRKSSRPKTLEMLKNT